MTPRDHKGNIGIFVNGFHTTADHDKFLKYVAPMYMRASKERKMDLFFELFFDAWFDRFPVILDDGFDDDEPDGAVDPHRVEWAKTVQKKNLQNVLCWFRSIFGKKGRYYGDWMADLGIPSDRRHRRNEYFTKAFRGTYLFGHQYDVVVTPEERAQAERTFEEHIEDIRALIRPVPHRRRAV
ncbi:hypothetical protein Hypma_005156 [Hypsizygus marmoreus]|uniref:Uncharacterized protein n=1 Tax=Hypsizygus marmoreus TaxID=39966 RepID=A0A369JYR3_HYPMA|nr:hypothetical protein Hypma_005156 [Hypsizygus marmoreus]